MSSKISVGSTVFGEANIGCVVSKIDGDILTIETSGGSRDIPISAIIRWESPQPLSLIDRLLSIASVGKQEAIEQLIIITAEFSINSIYEASLDLDTFAGIFIRRSLSELSPVEFEAIGKDGSEGKYGVLTFPDSPPPISLTDDGSFAIGDRVTHTDLYHCHGADVGTIELVDSFGDYHVRWKSDGQVRRYSAENLKLCEIVSRSHPYR